jgi:hypothetical protein
MVFNKIEPKIGSLLSSVVRRETSVLIHDFAQEGFCCNLQIRTLTLLFTFPFRSRGPGPGGLAKGF